jgi:hypothetical protein
MLEVRKRGFLKSPVREIRTPDLCGGVSANAAEKIVYLTIQDMNANWSNGKLRGFASAYHKLQEMFDQRYKQ